MTQPPANTTQSPSRDSNHSAALRVLTVEDSEEDAALIIRELRRGGYNPIFERVETAETMRAALDKQGWDIILADYVMPHFCGLDALTLLRERGLDVPLIIVSGKIGEETAVEAVLAGANDYIMKGNLMRLVPAVKRELLEAEVRRERRLAERSLQEQMQLAALSANVGLALIQSDSLRHMLQLCAEAIVRHLDAAFARIWTLNEAANMLELEASAGMYTHIDGAHCRIPVGEFKVGLIAQERKPHLTNTVTEDPRISDQEWAKREGMVAFAGYPLIVEDRVVGVMGMFARNALTEATLRAMGAVANDIALGIQRKRAEAAINESERRLRTLFETVRLVVVGLNAEGNVEYVNPFFLDLTGFEQEEVLGKQWFGNFVPDREQHEIWTVFHELIRNESHVHHQNAILTKSGDERVIAWNNSLLRDRQGNIIGTLSIGEDVTGHKRLEEQLRHSQKMEAIGQLTGGIAHDFNNILTAIIGYANLLQMKLSEGDPLRVYVDQMLSASEKAASLTQSLLTFSRKQIVNPRPVDLNEILEKVGKLLLRLIGENIELTISPARQKLIVAADTGQIEQVLMNLATNARDAMPDGGLLTMSTDLVRLDNEFFRCHGYGQPGTYALISTVDTGTGMDERTKEKIFEPFFTTKEVGKGTGLGLSIVYGIIKQHHGYINVYSEPGRGTAFKIYLPLVKSEVQGRDSVSSGLPPGGTETVLLAEDEAEVRTLTSAVLEEFGYRVIEAVDGDDAINKFKENRDGVQLLILDVIMPRKGGAEVYDEIKKTQPNIKVLFTSGYPQSLLHQKGILDSGLNFISKPVSSGQMLRTIREVLEGRANNAR